jgi:hypothetical protein
MNRRLRPTSFRRRAIHTLCPLALTSARAGPRLPFNQRRGIRAYEATQVELLVRGWPGRDQSAVEVAQVIDRRQREHRQD